MASAKKKLDEEHLKLLREMVALAHNKHCFDCHQRGPTYINMTIGSFICTACSGLLRGLNPPHRVKSISMASFSADEIEFIKNRGNDFCRKVWLGTFDSRMAPEIDSKDESRMREAMVLRYERKRWYVQPTDAMYQDARRQNVTASTAKSASASSGGAKPLTLLVGGSSAPSANAQQDKIAKSPTTPSQSIQRPSHSNSVPPPISAAGLQSINLPSPRSPPAAAASQPQQQKPASMDLLADFSSSDPFGSQTSKATQEQAAPAVDDGFADFSGFSSQSAPAASVQMPVFSQSVMLPSNSAAAGSKPVSIPAAVPAMNSDKYSALSDLESVFSTTSISGGFGGVSGTGLGPGASVNWGGGPPIGGTSTMWGPPASAAPMAAVGGVGASGFGAAPPLGMSPPSYSSIAAMAAAGNPFGAPQMVGQPMAYGAAPAGFGQAQQFGMPAAGYGYYGPQAVAASPQSAGFGVFGPVAPGSAQFTAHNGVAGGSNGFSIGAQPAGFMAAPQTSAAGGGGLFGGPGAGQQVPPQPSQRASWSHPVSSPAANPFMGPPAAAAGTRATNIATNPFL